MKTDLHIHSNHSDGALSIEEILREAKLRNIGLLSITDHDSIACQEFAFGLARKAGLSYVSGVELNVTFSHPKFNSGKPVSLDFLGYQFVIDDAALRKKLEKMAEYREARAAKILKNLNAAFENEGIKKLTRNDFAEIQTSVDGSMGRPHIADYLVRKKIVKSRQEAFDKYLVKCDVPKYPLHLGDASRLVKDAGGRIVLAHPNDPHGISLASLSKSLFEQTEIIQQSMLQYIDGVECWHSRSDSATTRHYVSFAKEHGLIMTGGSDCHQKPIVMGTVKVPKSVVNYFKF